MSYSTVDTSLNATRTVQVGGATVASGSTASTSGESQAVIEQFAPAYEDNANGVAKVEQRFNATLCAADTAVKSSAGFLHALVISCNDAAPTAGSVIVYNNTAESGTQVFNHTFTTTPFTPVTIMMNTEMSTGIYVGFTTTNDVNVTAIWR